jgi:hypothetical protein
MTRLFDALNKARSAHPAGVPVAPALRPPPAVAPPGQQMPFPAPPIRPAPGSVPPLPMRAARPAPERAAAPRDGDRSRIVALEARAELATDVQREMAGLRISLEAALTLRIPRTVMFIASQGGEGTSTVAAQFAQSLASDERLRVLLVDAHLRRPAFGSDGTSVEPAATRPRRAPSDAPGPDLMPIHEDSLESGAITPDSLRGCLDAVASRYDWVVIDGPPVLESPDAATLGAVADGVVVVVQAGRTKRPVLARSVDLIGRAGGRVLGIVLNRRRLEIPEFIYRRI